MDKKYIFQQNQYNPTEAAFYETVYHQCNGYVGIRNTLEFDSGNAHPGIFIRDVHGYGISYVKNQLNIPNWLDVKLIVEGETINLDTVNILHFHRQLTIDNAVVSVDVVVKDSKGRETKLYEEHILMQEPKNVSVLRLFVEPLNYSGYVSVEFCNNYCYGNNYHGGFLGDNVKTHHWNKIDYHRNDKSYIVMYQANDSEIKLAIDSEINTKQDADITSIQGYKREGIRFYYSAKQGQQVEFLRKTVFYADTNLSEIYHKIEDSKQCFYNYTYSDLSEYNERLWRLKWNSVDIGLTGDEKLTAGLMYSMFELLQIDNSDKIGSNIASRGLSSEYHGGHYFFNTDIYLVQYYCFFNPELAKSLIMFRIKTFEIAKENATRIGCKGAFWSEETGVDGRPAGPTEVWDYSKRECSYEHTGELVKHLPSLIVYSMKVYEDIIGEPIMEDDVVISIIVEIIRYYMCIIQYNREQDCYDIKDIIGIDEYHTHVDNNYFTVEMVRWAIDYCVKLVEKHQKFCEAYHISQEEISKWDDVKRKLYHGNIKNNVIEQHTGFFDLEDFKIIEYLDNGIPKMSKELREKINRFEDFNAQVVKQCDVVMFQSMFPEMFSKQVLEDSFRYYEARTLHESSLSATHAGLVAAYIGDMDLAYKYMKISSRFNLDYEPRDFYNNGLHYAAYAGAWLILLYGILGIRTSGKLLEVNPIWGSYIKEVSCILHFRAAKIRVSMQENCMNLCLVSEKSISVLVNDKDYILLQNKNIKIAKEYIV